MKVIKVFNNNVVLALDAHGQEAVLIGRGIGFQRKHDDAVDESKIERIFQAGATDSPERLAALISAIPPEHIALTEEIAALATAEFGEEVSRHALIPLADHVSFALRRADAGTAISYPLAGEVALLYPREVAFSKRALDLVAARTGVRLSDVEAVPMALHFVNAQLDSRGPVNRVVEMTHVFSEVVELVQRRYGIELDDDSVDVARFITHLRYLFVRQEQGQCLSDEQGTLLAALAASHPAEYTCAEEIQKLLVQRFDWDAGNDEVVYLTLHVARLTGASGQRAGDAR